MLASASALSQRGLQLLRPQRTVQRMRATCGSPAGAAAAVAVCWVALALALCAAPASAQDVLSDAAREVATCGSCTWFVVGGSPGALVKNGTCEADCSGWLDLSYEGIGTISEGAFAGLPLLERLDLRGNNLQEVPVQAFSRLPRLQRLYLYVNPLAGLETGTFANNTALEWLGVWSTALACVPADGIPDTTYINGAARCPAGCKVGTVYDAAADACVACPAGLQPVAPPGTVGGALATCVPAGWDAVLLVLCGSCAFWRTAATNVLVRTGSCEADCSGYLWLSWKGIGTISEGAFAGLPLLEGLHLDGNNLQHVPVQAFSRLPRLQRLELYDNNLQEVPVQAFSHLPRLQRLTLNVNPLAGLETGTFANNTALRDLYVDRTALACVPAGGIPDTASISGAARCPADCEVGTVYDAAADACVACPAGLQTVAPPGTVGGALGTCVPAGWDAVLLDRCGSCVFWRTAATNVLVRTGSCEADCSGALVLFDKGIAAVAPGVFANLTGLERLYISHNPLGCVPGVPDSVEIDADPWQVEKTPRCPADCAVGTFFVQPSNACPTAGDGICDEPVWCEAGTDCADCQDVLGYATCDGSAGVCLPCPAGLTTAGVGAESCVDPAALASGETSSASAVATTPAPTPSPCTGGARLFAVAGTALCVPERFFPAPVVQDCLLAKTWKQLCELGRVFTTGGLGREMVAGEFEVWVCTRHSSCGSAAGAVCFTFREGLEVFVPWGLESELNFMRKR